jgi:hypothetical protein
MSTNAMRCRLKYRWFKILKLKKMKFFGILNGPFVNVHRPQASNRLLHGIVACLVSLKSGNRSVVGNKLLCGSQGSRAWDAEAVFSTVYRLGRFPG